MKKLKTKIVKNITDQDELKSFILEDLSEEFTDIVKAAIEFAEEKHAGQKRISGEDFIIHPLNVGAIVASLNMDVSSIIVALLHNTLKGLNRHEQKGVLKEIAQKFGEEVSTMVDVMNQFSNGTRSLSEPEIITKYILRSSDDLRLIMIKLADRLHNARTIDALPKQKRYTVAKNLINIYSPLATYLNLYEIKVELEEIAFRILNPHEYEIIDMKLREASYTNTKRVEKITKYLEKLLKDSGIKYEVVYGRIKGHYSIYRKLQLKKDIRDLENIDITIIHDLLAFSIIVHDQEQCYEVAKKLFQCCDPDISSYDDFIKHPKPNGYKSIQFDINIPEVSSKKMEVQIKTLQMHHNNIYGPASHFAYKLSGASQQNSKYYWIKELHSKMYEYRIQPKKSRSIPIQSDIFSSKIYAFTPKNLMIELPVGSTVIDFAYCVHSSIGNKAVYALINGKKCELSTMIQNGDKVEVVTDSTKELPDREWLQFVRTRKARDAIETEYKKYLMRRDIDFTHVI